MLYEKELIDKILGCAFEVYNTLGSGFLEKVYENALNIELNKNNLKSEVQKKLVVLYKSQQVGEYYTDIIVEDKIILELKCCSEISKSHIAQLMNYLTSTGIKIGYILNFGTSGKMQFKRIVK